MVLKAGTPGTIGMNPGMMRMEAEMK